MVYVINMLCVILSPFPQFFKQMTDFNEFFFLELYSIRSQPNIVFSTFLPLSYNTVDTRNS
jgi:hypothetical protein